MKYLTKINESELGLTLVELLAVIVILGVLAAIAVPVYLSHIERTEGEVCRVNRDTIGKDYELDLMLRDRVHSEVVFRDFLEMNGLDGCPVGWGYTYGADGEMEFNRHPGSEGEENNKEMMMKCLGCKCYINL